MIRYLLLVPISLVLTLVALPLAPILPLFASPQYGWSDNHSYLAVEPRLPSWLNWFMTPDNSLYGDASFQAINGTSYLAQVKWLLRNPCYSFGLEYLHAPYVVEVSGNPLIKDNDNAVAGSCLTKSNGLFLYRSVTKIPFVARCIYCNFGWNIAALSDPHVDPKPDPYQATFVFSPRISGFR